MNYPSNVTTYSVEDTSKLAAEFASTLKGGEVVVLNGLLGAGKTYFIKNAGMYFRITNINSPTFSIVNEYLGNKKINHFDFYRINSVSELNNIGLDDYFAEEDSITFIEWGNLFPDILPHNRIEINIKINEDLSREFQFISYGQ